MYAHMCMCVMSVCIYKNVCGCVYEYVFLCTCMSVCMSVYMWGVIEYECMHMYACV